MEELSSLDPIQNLLNNKWLPTFLKIRERVFHLLDHAGAVRCNEGLLGIPGLTLVNVSAFDLMVQLGEITKIYQGDNEEGHYQDDVYVRAKK